MVSVLWPHVLTLPRPDGGSLELRPLRWRDRDEWESLRAENEDWISPWESEAPDAGRKLRFGQMVRYYDRAARLGEMQPFAIAWGRRLVGQMTLAGVTWGAQLSGTAGYWVARRYAGMSIAPMCLAALVDHSVYTLGLHRVEVNIRPENAASLRVVEKLGFRDEGVRRNFLYVDGGWRHHRTFALTSEDLAGERLFETWYRSASNPSPAPK